jgi:serine/threonine protein kinase
MPAQGHLKAFLGEEGRRLERLIEEFETAWQEGREPDLADYLPPDGPGRGPALVELVHTDMEYRWRRGVAAPLRAYLVRFPELERDRAAVQGLAAAEWELRQVGGSSALWPGGGELGRFRLLASLGAGSFGLVFRAWDTELHRVVAVKVPRAHLAAGADEADRFMREARSAARLRHPHIVALYEARRTDEFCYLVMEYVSGVTLDRRLALGRPPVRQAAVWVAQMADALAYAHSEGVVHRDLKPANVLLDGSDRPHLTDFGLARWVGESGPAAGTPAYMPPEQVRSDDRPADGRADQYSLGVILYEMLTGRLPFGGSGHTLLARILQTEPLPPRRLDPAIPRDLEAICLKAISKDPDRRYPSAAALADDLRRFLDCRPVQARPTGPAGRVWRWARREPALAGLAAALAVAAASGLTAVVVEWRRAEANLAAAQRREQELGESLRRADRAVTVLGRLAGVSHYSEENAPPTRDPALRLSLDYHEDFIRRHDGDPAVKPQLARSYHRVAMHRFALHEHEAAAAAFRRAVDGWAELVREYPEESEYRIEQANSLCSFGRLYKYEGRQAEAAIQFERAADLLPPLLRRFPRKQYLYDRLCIYHAECGYAYRKLGRHDDALRAWERVVAVAASLPSEVPAKESLRFRNAVAHYWVGVLEDKRGRRDVALAAHLRAAELFGPLCCEFPGNERYERFAGLNAKALGELQAEARFTN